MHISHRLTSYTASCTYCSSLCSTKKSIRLMMVRTSTRIPANRPLWELWQSTVKCWPERVVPATSGRWLIGKTVPWGRVGIAAQTLDLDTNWSNWSVSRSTRFTPEERDHCLHCVGGWMGSRVCLNIMVANRKVLALAGNRISAFQLVTSHFIDGATLAPI
jgi:hypothetical protein